MANTTVVGTEQHKLVRKAAVAAFIGNFCRVV